MSLSFALPLGHPAASLPAATRTARLSLLQSLLDRGTDTFSGDSTLHTYRFRNAGAPPWAKQVFAPWSGTLARQADGSLTVELAPAGALELASRLPPRVPVPRRITFGPVAVAGVDLHAGSVTVTAGQGLGTLDGDALQLGFETEDRYWIDPRWCLAAFDAALLWDLPAGSSNPLVIPGPASAPIALAGPTPPTEAGKPMLAIGIGGQPAFRVFNPPETPPTAPPPRCLSFLSRDPIVVGVFQLPAGNTLQVRIDDVTGGPARSSAGQFIPAATPEASVQFTPAVDLRPSHAAYRPGEGSTAVPEPLCYRVRVDLHAPGGSLTATLRTVLQQDLHDVVRQEYLFHSPPFQTGPALALPADESIRPPAPGNGLVQPEDVCPPYLADKLSVDSGMLLAGVGWIRRRYAKTLFEDSTTPVALQAHLTADLLAQGWVDPETNEHLAAPIDDLQQWSKVLRLAPFQTQVPGTDAGALYLALARAAADYLAELRGRNPSVQFAETAVRLQAGAAELWRWDVDSTGATDREGADFAAAVGGTASLGAAATAASAAAARLPSAAPTGAEATTREQEATRAAAVRVTFVPRTVTDSLVPPDVPSYPADPARPAGRRNLILLGAEMSNSPVESRIPVDVAAKSIERALKAQFQQDEVVTKVVGDPISLLAELGAFRATTPPQFRYVFVLSHAYPDGLQLTHGPGLTDIHDAQVGQWLQEVYGRRYAIGVNDRQEFKTHQFRISNLTKLSRETQARLRRSMSGAEAIFLLGCSSGAQVQTPGVDPNKPRLALTLARATGVTVLGSPGPAKFFIHEVGSEWQVLYSVTGDVTRESSAAVSHYGDQVLLLPGEHGEYVKWIDLDSADILGAYRKFLRKVDPSTPDPAP